MASETERLALTHYDGGDSPKWIGDNIPSYNSDMLKIDEWAAKIDPIAGANDTRPNPTIIGASDITNRGDSETFARADHRHGILMGTDNDVKQLTVVTSNTNLKGTSVNLARADHGHHVAVAAPSGILSPVSSNAEGSATTLVRSDHSHALTNVCALDDSRILDAVDTYTALMTGINAPSTTHTHNQYSETGHKHSYEDILDLQSTPSFHIKGMDSIVLEQEINQAGKNIWTWYSDSLLVSNIIEGDIIELQGMLRSTSPTTSVGVALTPVEQLPASPEMIIRMFTSAYGGQSAGVSIKYKFSAEDLAIISPSQYMRVWIGFFTTSESPIHTRVTGSYTSREKYTALSYTLYGPYISA